jgi:hypothetical protein
MRATAVLLSWTAVGLRSDTDTGVLWDIRALTLRAPKRLKQMREEWDILTNESWWSGCFLRCLRASRARDFFIDQLTKEVIDDHARCHSIVKRQRWWTIEVNSCSIISSLSYFMKSSSMIPFDDRRFFFCVFWEATSTLLFLSLMVPWVQCAGEVEWIRNGAAKKGKKKERSEKRR